VDTAGTTISAGSIMFSHTCGANNSSFIDLTPFDLFMAPGEIWTFSISNTTSGIASCAVNWQEDVQ